MPHTRVPYDLPSFFLTKKRRQVFCFCSLCNPRSCVAHACLSIIDARAICLGFRKQYAGGCNSFLTNGSTQKHPAATRYVVACEVFALVFKKGGKYKNPVPLKNGYHEKLCIDLTDSFSFSFIVHGIQTVRRGHVQPAHRYVGASFFKPTRARSVAQAGSCCQVGAKKCNRFTK